MLAERGFLKLYGESWRIDWRPITNNMMVKNVTLGAAKDTRGKKGNRLAKLITNQADDSSILFLHVMTVLRDMISSIPIHRLLPKSPTPTPKYAPNTNNTNCLRLDNREIEFACSNLT